MHPKLYRIAHQMAQPRVEPVNQSPPTMEAEKVAPAGKEEPAAKADSLSAWATEPDGGVQRLRNPGKIGG